MAKEEKQSNSPQQVKKIVTCECGKKIEVWLEIDITEVINALANMGKMNKPNPELLEDKE